MVHLQFYENCKLSQAGKRARRKKKLGCTDCFISVKSANVISPLVCHKFLPPKSCHAQLSRICLHVVIPQKQSMSLT